MPATITPHVQVILNDERVPAPLEAALKRTKASVSFRPIREALRGGSGSVADAVVVVAPTSDPATTQRLRVLFDRMADHPRATLVVHGDDCDRSSFAFPAALPISFTSTDSEDELSVRLATMLDMRASLESLHRGMRHSEAQHVSIQRRLARQLRLASEVQRGFLPASLPSYGPVSFRSFYRPAQYVSGDIYDVRRLDEEHVGITVADATGEGIPAALLTVFIKRALHGKEVFDGHYRLLEPAEVLQRLNEEIIEAELAECPFVAVVYGILNTRTLELRIARGGAPYPLLRRAEGTVSLIQSGGGVVGVAPEFTFETQSFQLRSGDALILHSDGLEKLVVPHLLAPPIAAAFENAAEAASLATADDSACGLTPLGGASDDDPLLHSGWVNILAARGVDAAVDEVVARFDALRRIKYPLDDITLLAVRID